MRELQRFDVVRPEGVHDLGAVEKTSALLGRLETVLDEVIGEDLLQGAAACVLADDVLRDSLLAR